MSMTRRDWLALASAIKYELKVWEDVESTTRDGVRCIEARTAIFAIKQAAYRLAGVLSAQSTRFDSTRFLTECGIPQSNNPTRN